MADIKSPEERSRNMSRIRSKDTRPEEYIRKTLFAQGYRYRKNYKDLPGKPDIVITKYKIAIFCDSEFFHGKDWKNLKEQLGRGKNAEFWTEKISKNMNRDREVNTALRGMGWTVLRFWGNDIKKHTDECVRTVSEAVMDYKLNCQNIGGE